MFQARVGGEPGWKKKANVKQTVDRPSTDTDIVLTPLQLLEETNVMETPLIYSHTNANGEIAVSS